MRLTNERPATPTNLEHACTRDASFNATGKPSGKMPRLHFPHPNEPNVSACCRVLLSGSCIPAEDADDVERCRQPGCREGWAAVANPDAGRPEGPGACPTT